MLVGFGLVVSGTWGDRPVITGHTVRCAATDIVVAGGFTVFDGTGQVNV
jgi:hypothetical protein